MKITITKHKFDGIFFYNRWKSRKFQSLSTWTLIGINKFYFNPFSYNISFCFFGFEFGVLMRKEITQYERNRTYLR